MYAKVHPITRKGSDGKPYTKYQARWDNPVTGKEASKIFALRREAQAYLDTVTADIVTGKYADPRDGRITFAAYADMWAAAQLWETSTRDKNMSKLRTQILPVFGDRPLISITATELQGFATRLGRAMAASTARDTWFIVSGLFRAAHRDLRIPTDPAVHVVAPAKVNVEITIPTPAEVAALIEAAPDFFKLAIQLAAGAGLRQSEITGLAVDAITFPTGTPILGVQRAPRPTLSVERTLACVSRHPMFLKPPKSRAGVREIGTAGRLAAMITEHVRAYPPVSVSLPWERPDGRPITVDLVLTENGVPINRTRFAALWNATMRAAGLTGINPHSLRHYAVSSQIRNGATPKEVQVFAGHADHQTTWDTYGHLWPDSANRIAAGIDAALDFTSGRHLKAVEG